MKISILCAAYNSVYKKIPDVEVYDRIRDAATFRGDTPIVAHPPCRAWSAFTAHQAKPVPGEAELGLLCADFLQQCGGVLEQPAHSRLFHAAGLPQPGELHPTLTTIYVEQAWWGYPVRKATWLCCAHIDVRTLIIPYRHHDPRAGEGDRRRTQRMSRAARSATPRAFAEWLVAAARKCRR